MLIFNGLRLFGRVMAIVSQYNQKPKLWYLKTIQGNKNLAKSNKTRRKNKTLAVSSNNHNAVANKAKAAWANVTSDSKHFEFFTNR